MTSEKCWMCGELATTREHQIKKTDLKLMSQGVSFKKGDRLIKTLNNGKKSFIQGLDSKEVKYKKNLCGYCNNTRSEPWDKAYEALMNFAYKNHITIARDRKINLKLVYGANVKKAKMDLFKYFAKAFGCAINEINDEVPSVIFDVINEKSFDGKIFFINISACEELLEKNPMLDGFAGCSNLESLNEKESGKPVSYRWAQNLGWLVISYFYNLKNIDGGIPWSGKSKSIEFSNFSILKINT
jgi:hypothetical protein